MCVSGPAAGLCGAPLVSSGDELPPPHASERQVRLSLVLLHVLNAKDELERGGRGGSNQIMEQKNPSK